MNEPKEGDTRHTKRPPEGEDDYRDPPCVCEPEPRWQEFAEKHDDELPDKPPGN